MRARGYFSVVTVTGQEQLGASSTDGRTFEVRGLPGAEVPGDLVVLRTSAGLCSQRPSRIHEAVLAQCDNLALMRMNSPGDLNQLEKVFGFAPAEMLRAAPGFKKGECLMAGTFAPAPAFVQIRARRTQEGGSDVAVPDPAMADENAFTPRG